MCDVQSASTLNPGDSSNLLKSTVDATWVGSLERGSYRSNVYSVICCHCNVDLTKHRPTHCDDDFKAQLK